MKQAENAGFCGNTVDFLYNDDLTRMIKFRRKIEIIYSKSRRDV